MIIRICWVVTAIACGLGLFQYLAIMGANGAPQQAAGAAMAAAIVIIPYVFTRAMEGLILRAKSS